MDKIYRVIKRTPLSTGHVQGQIVGGRAFKTQKNVDALVARNVIMEISGPPLSELPGWKVKAGKLAKLDVITTTDFLMRDTGELSNKLGYKKTTVDRWKKEVQETWLLAIPARASK